MHKNIKDLLKIQKDKRYKDEPKNSSRPMAIALLKKSFPMPFLVPKMTTMAYWLLGTFPLKRTLHQSHFTPRRKSPNLKK